MQGLAVQMLEKLDSLRSEIKDTQAHTELQTVPPPLEPPPCAHPHPATQLNAPRLPRAQGRLAGQIDETKKQLFVKVDASTSQVVGKVEESTSQVLAGQGSLRDQLGAIETAHHQKAAADIRAQAKAEAAALIAAAAAEAAAVERTAILQHGQSVAEVVVGALDEVQQAQQEQVRLLGEASSSSVVVRRSPAPAPADAPEEPMRAPVVLGVMDAFGLCRHELPPTVDAAVMLLEALSFPQCATVHSNSAASGATRPSLLGLHTVLRHAGTRACCATTRSPARR
jgi:hypothetical protein